MLLITPAIIMIHGIGITIITDRLYTLVLTGVGAVVILITILTTILITVIGTVTMPVIGMVIMLQIIMAIIQMDTIMAPGPLVEVQIVPILPGRITIIP
jgi:hypothetical protein